MSSGAPKGPPALSTLEELMAQALAMEFEARQRYGELADSMEVHNNREVAELFRKMAAIESKHGAQIMAEMGWTEAPPLPEGTAWEGYESAETVPADEIHYLMTPWHALQLALKAEQRAERFFAQLAEAAGAEQVRQAALELRDEEHEHVELIEAWLKKVPEPDRNWAEDPDPPRYDE